MAHHHKYYTMNVWTLIVNNPVNILWVPFIEMFRNSFSHGREVRQGTWPTPTRCQHPWTPWSQIITIRFYSRIMIITTRFDPCSLVPESRLLKNMRRVWERHSTNKEVSQKRDFPDLTSETSPLPITSSFAMSARCLWHRNLQGKSWPQVNNSWNKESTLSVRLIAPSESALRPPFSFFPPILLY